MNQPILPNLQLALTPSMEICQADYPLDRYDAEIVPYAKEYLALPDRKYQTIVDWMEPYIHNAQQHFGDSLLLLAHYYMGGEIVKLVERFGGYIGDSYQLSIIASKMPEKSLIIKSAVHFMAEAVCLLAEPHQQVYITNPRSGCTMEMLAKDYMVEPAFLELNERYGADTILPICYMNTSGRVKALTGAQGGAVCTSGNVKKIMQWALEQDKKILFIPDQHMGENVAGWLGIDPDRIAYWPSGKAGAQFRLQQLSTAELEHFDRAQLILFSSECGVHTYYQPEMVHYWKHQGYHVSVHPECRKIVVDVSDSTGSTAFLWDHIMHDRAATKKYAVGTENHMVRNLKHAAAQKGISVVNLGEATIAGLKGLGCGCATMSRNDPPHLVGLLDLLRQGKAMPQNEVKPGDVVNEFTGQRERLSQVEQDKVIQNARAALKKMVEITEWAG